MNKNKITTNSHARTHTRNIHESYRNFEDIQSFESVVNSDTLTHIVDAAQN